MRFAANENFNGKILNGLNSRIPELDIVRIQDTTLYEAPDDQLLAWLSDEGRVLLTHDVQTMPGYVYKRVAAGQAVPGVIVIRQDTPIGRVLDELEVAIGAGTPEDFENQVKFIPFR